MGWRLNEINILKYNEEGKFPQAGDFWYIDWYEVPGLSPEYKNDWANKRAPACLRLPGKRDWVMDKVASNLNGLGWRISGEFPSITAHPSIGKYKLDGTFAYHGWLKNGILSDDIDKKVRFPEDEKNDNYIGRD